MSDQVDLIWHGGEPLVAGLETFQEIVSLQQQVSSSYGVRFRNRIQTNGTLIDDNWAELFRQNDFKIGVSLDGPSWLHDLNRVNKGGQGSFARVMRGIDNLRNRGLDFGVIAVVTKMSLGHEEEVFSFFVDNGIKRFDFVPCAEEVHSVSRIQHSELTIESLDQGGYSDFIIRIFDLWFELDDPTIRIRFLEQILTTLLGGQTTLCSLTSACEQYITIDYDGRVFPCDNLLNIPGSVFGDLHSSSLPDILLTTRRQRFLSAIKEKSLECRNCGFIAVCGGGCSKYSFMRGDWTRVGENYFCLDRQRIFSHMLRQLRLDMGSNLSPSVRQRETKDVL